MLTPNQIKNVMFTKSAMGGYKINEVDEFILVVCGDYSKLYKENSELLANIESLNAKIKEYSENEDNIKTTLVTAQKMADKIVRDAKDERDQIKESTTKEFGGIVGEAKIKAKNMVEDATNQANSIITEAKDLSDSLLDDTNRQVEQQQRILSELKSEISSFRERVLSMYDQQVAFVKDLPSLEKKVQDGMSAGDKYVVPEKDIPEAKLSTPILDNINSFLDKNFETMEEISKELEETAEVPQEQIEAAAEEAQESIEDTVQEASSEISEAVEDAQEQAEAAVEDAVEEIDRQEGSKGVLKVGDDYDIFDGDDD